MMSATAVVGLVVAVMQLVASVIALIAAARAVQAAHTVKTEVRRLQDMRSEIELVRLEMERDIALASAYQTPIDATRFH